MVKQWLLLLTALTMASALIGCRTTEAFRAELDKRVGTSVEIVIREVGPPISYAELSTGEKVYKWSRSNVLSGLYATRYSVTPTFAQMHCSIILTTDPYGVIKSYNFEGNDCRK